MKLIRISGPSAKLDKIITALCELGDFQPENADRYISASMHYSSVSEESPYEKLINSIKEFTQNYGFELESGSKAKTAVIDEGTGEYVESIDDRLRKFDEKEHELASQLEECTTAVEHYSHFTGLKMDLDELFGCEFVSARFGHLPKDGYVRFSKSYGDNPYILFCPCSSDADGYWGAYFAPKNRVNEVDRIFAVLQFERLHIPSAIGTAQEIIDKLNQNIAIIKQEQIELKKEISGIWEKEGEKIKALYIKLLRAQQVFEMRKYAVYHGKNCLFVGWIPAADEKKVVKKLTKFTDFIVDFEDPEENAANPPPTKLKMIRIFRPFSYFVQMYGLPGPNDIDITGFVAITYTLLFGIMFGDLGQGLVLCIGGFLAWKLKNIALGKILIPCGLSSAFFGFMFGSVFGFEDALDPVYKKLGMSGKPISVMDSINTVLLFAIGIGVTLVIVAMVLNVLACLKNKKFGQALFTENGLTGIIVYVGGANLAYSFMAGEGIFSTKISAVMLIVGVLILFNKEIIAGSIDEKKLVKPESVSDYIMQNLFECIEYILSYFSNTVSFLRVGAFVIVHASMMMVVFTLAGDNPASARGIIVIVLGNIVVIALEGLLTGIQGLRLEFYEMFSRFYEGDGRPFEAVKIAN